MIYQAEHHRYRVEEAVSDLQSELGLGWIQIHNSFNEEERDDRVACRTEADWEYRQATLHWALPAVARLTDRDLDDVVIHEFVHILMAPVDEYIPSEPHVLKLNEFVVESISQAIQAARGE